MRLLSKAVYVIPGLQSAQGFLLDLPSFPFLVVIFGQGLYLVMVAKRRGHRLLWVQLHTCISVCEYLGHCGCGQLLIGIKGVVAIYLAATGCG